MAATMVESEHLEAREFLLFTHQCNMQEVEPNLEISLPAGRSRDPATLLDRETMEKIMLVPEIMGPSTKVTAHMGETILDQEGRSSLDRFRQHIRHNTRESTLESIQETSPLSILTSTLDKRLLH